MTTYSISRRALAEGAGTAGLVLSIFGAGHFASKIGASPAEAALIGTFAVVGTFVCVLQAIGAVTGGHINPAVTVSFWVVRQIQGRHALAYVVAQLTGAVGGALLANKLWGSHALSLGSTSVSGAGYAAECLAAGGLIAVIHATVRGGSSHRLPFVVPAFLGAASFAAPLSIANPAVALAKTIAGAGPSAAALTGLLGCELGAAVVAALAVEWLYISEPTSAEAGPPVVVPGVAVTYELVCSPSSDEIVRVGREVVERLVRPTDMVVQHRDGRLLVLLDSLDDGAVASFERRANDHVTLALLAAGLPVASVELLPAAASPAAVAG